MKTIFSVLRLGFAVIICACLCRCAHKQVFKDLNAWNGEKDKSVELAVRAVKIRKHKANITILVKNNYPFTVVIAENSVRFSINGDEGAGDGNPRWVLKPGDVTTEKMVFNLADNESGEAILLLEHIYQGESATVSGVDTKSKTTGSGVAFGFRNVAVGTSNRDTKTTSENYVKKTAVEGEALPSVKLIIPE